MELVYETLPIIGILVGIFIIGVFSVVGSLIMINNVLNKPIKAEVDFVKEQAISTKKDMEDIKKQVNNHIPTKIENVRTELKADINELKNEINEIKGNIEKIIDVLTRR